MKRVLCLSALSMMAVLVFAPVALAQQQQQVQEEIQPGNKDCTDLLGVDPEQAQKQAQALLEQNPSDPNNYDFNENGVACEYTGYSVSSGVQFEDGTGAIASSGAPQQMPNLPNTGGPELLLPMAGITLAGLGVLGLLVLRRRTS